MPAVVVVAVPDVGAAILIERAHLRLAVPVAVVIQVPDLESMAVTRHLQPAAAARPRMPDAAIGSDAERLVPASVALPVDKPHATCAQESSAVPETDGIKGAVPVVDGDDGARTRV